MVVANNNTFILNGLQPKWMVIVVQNINESLVSLLTPALLIKPKNSNVF